MEVKIESPYLTLMLFGYTLLALTRTNYDSMPALLRHGADCCMVVHKEN